MTEDRKKKKGVQGQFQNIVQFGFVQEDDELEIILYIDSVLNKDLDGEHLDKNFEDDWMTMLPVAYGKISL